MINRKYEVRYNGEQLSFGMSMSEAQALVRHEAEGMHEEQAADLVIRVQKMDMNEMCLAILPALEVRMQNNDWPSGRNQPEVYNLEVMHRNLAVESDLMLHLRANDLGDLAQQAFCAYCQIHDLVDNVWDEDRAYQLIQALVIS